MAPAIYSSENELEAIKGTPVIVVQGDNDNLVDVNITRRWAANMKKIFDFFDQARRK